MPSTTTWPKGSGSTDACTSTSNCASSCPTSVRKPAKSTRPATPSRSARSGRLRAYSSSSAPKSGAPTMRATESPSGNARANASRKTCCPFHGAIRPTMPILSVPFAPFRRASTSTGLGTTKLRRRGGSVRSVACEFATIALGRSTEAARTSHTAPGEADRVAERAQQMNRRERALARQVARAFRERQDLDRNAAVAERVGEGTVLREDRVRVDVELGQDAEQRELAAGQDGGVVEKDDARPRGGCVQLAMPRGD